MRYSALASSISNRTFIIETPPHPGSKRDDNRDGASDDNPVDMFALVQLGSVAKAEAARNPPPGAGRERPRGPLPQSPLPSAQPEGPQRAREPLQCLHHVGGQPVHDQARTVSDPNPAAGHALHKDILCETLCTQRT
jgi:hypothetical protein